MNWNIIMFNRYFLGTKQVGLGRSRTYVHPLQNYLTLEFDSFCFHICLYSMFDLALFSSEEWRCVYIMLVAPAHQHTSTPLLSLLEHNIWYFCLFTGETNKTQHVGETEVLILWVFGEPGTVYLHQPTFSDPFI